MRLRVLVTALLLAAWPAGAYIVLGGANAVRGSQVPGDVLDLSKFNISLPISDTLGTLYNKTANLGTPVVSSCYTDTGSSPAAITATELANSVSRTVEAGLSSYSHPSYFYALNGVVHYIFPAWGATTSTNTDSPRTELRSIIGGTGATGSNASRDFIPQNGPRWRLKGGVARVNARNNTTHIFQIHPDKDAANPSGSSDVLLLVSYKDGALSASIKKNDQSGTYSTQALGTTTLATQSAPEAYDIQGWYDTTSASGDDYIRWTIKIAGVTNTYSQPVERAWRGRAMYFKSGAYSSLKYNCSDDAPAAIANNYTLGGTPTDYVEVLQTQLTVSLDNP